MYIKPTDLVHGLNAYQEQNLKSRRLDTYKNSNLQPDEVILSSQATEFGNSIKQIRESSDVRVELVERFKQKIQAGQYYIASYDIAAKFVETHKGIIE